MYVVGVYVLNVLLYYVYVTYFCYSYHRTELNKNNIIREVENIHILQKGKDQFSEQNMTRSKFISCISVEYGDGTKRT